MVIDWGHFTPGSALAGGAVIGVAVALLLLFNGRIAGISGILGGLLRPAAGDRAWRLAFIGGLLLAPAVYRLVLPLPDSQIDAGWGRLLCSGVLVGLGTRYASGCTSGHGVCGLARGSLRSLLATPLFMIAAAATVYVLRHVLQGWWS